MSFNQSNNTTFIVRQDPNALFTFIGHVFIIPIVSLIGFLLSILCLTVLFSQKLTGEDYKYLKLKSILHLLALTILCLSPVSQCAICSIAETLIANLYRIYIMVVTTEIVGMSISLVEVMISYSRLVVLKQKSASFISIYFKSTILIIIIIAISLNFPYFFSFQIQPLSPGSYRFRMIRTDFGNSHLYNIYLICLNIIHSTTALSALIIINICLIIEFKKYISRKSQLTTIKSINPLVSNVAENITKSLIENKSKYETDLNNVTLAKKNEQIGNSKQHVAAENNFTMLIIVSSLIFTFSRTIWFINLILIYLNQMFPGIIPPNLIIYIRFASILSLSIYYGSNFFIYISFNRMFKESLKKIFHL
jgi:hypothetical protein